LASLKLKYTIQKSAYSIDNAYWSNKMSICAAPAEPLRVEYGVTASNALMNKIGCSHSFARGQHQGQVCHMTEVINQCSALIL